MIVYDLICARQHRFEGWFASTEDYARQHEQTMIRCPVCDDAAIERRPSANVQVGRAALPAAESERETEAVTSGEAEALKLMRRLVANAENVGRAFPEEARKIHYDEAPARPIRGQASKEESAELEEEGIEFSSLPDFLVRDTH
jgi:hypothetical protein